MGTMQFFDEKGNMKAQLLNDDADNYAKSFASGLTMTQLRRFYNDAKALERKWAVEKTGKAEKDYTEAFSKILPLVYMLRAKAVSAEGKAPKGFIDWLGNAAISVKTHKDFEAFLLHFEAVVGFAKPLLKKN